MRDSRPAAPSLSNGRRDEGSRNSRDLVLTGKSLRVAPYTCVSGPSVKHFKPSGAPAILCSACMRWEMGKHTSKKQRSADIKITGGGGRKKAFEHLKLTLLSLWTCVVLLLCLF